MKTPRTALHTIALAFVVSTLGGSFVIAQGPLTPPGAPAPTMKTLQQVEPRTDLQATPAPPGVDTSNAGYHFIITQPGSYYLSANLGVTKFNGILINIAGVTVDLNGFQISRASGSGGSAISISAAGYRASVRNGSLKGFDYGVNSIFGVSDARGCAFRDLGVSESNTCGILAGTASVLESCRAHNNNSVGIRAGEGSTLTNCVAASNSGPGIETARGSSLANCVATNNSGNGIEARAGSTLVNCSATGNTGFYGISAHDGSSLMNCSASNNTVQWGIYVLNGYGVLTNCTATSNISSASFSGGIHVGQYSLVTHCSAVGNNSTAATHTASTGIGFYGNGQAVNIQNCTASGNMGDGIYVGSNSLVIGNNCAGNGFGAANVGAGIHSVGEANRIEGNNVTLNDRGIEVGGTGSLIIKNSARANSVANYQINAGNANAQIIAPGVNFVSTDPWANFAY